MTPIARSVSSSPWAQYWAPPSSTLRLILLEAIRRLRQPGREPPRPVEDWKRVNLVRLVFWVLFWAAGTVWVGNRLLHQPFFYLLVAIGLCFLFVLVNGIALGISDFNPISSAFVMTVFILAALGLHDPGVGLLCASVLAIATSEGGDMQQDRSTGWRLGTNRIVQFRYQVIGIAAGAVLSVALAKLFMAAYPILTQDQFAHPHLPGAQKWQSAYTFKMVGALRGITTAQPHVMKALLLGLGSGLLIELARKLLKSRPRYQALSARSPRGRALAFLLDAVLLPSPYAFALGGFVEFITAVWWAVGGVSASLFDALASQAPFAARLPRPRHPPRRHEHHFSGGRRPHRRRRPSRRECRRLWPAQDGALALNLRL